MMGEQRGIAPMRMEGNLAENWATWRSRFNNDLTASEVSKKDQTIQCAQLLHYIGEEGFKIYTTFQFADGEAGKLSVLMEKFEAHFVPKENLSYERYKFFSYRQQGNQAFEQFVTELKKQAQKCAFDTLEDSLIKSMIICGVTNSTMRERLLQDDSLSLQKAIDLCLAIETSKQRTVAIENKEVPLDVIRKSKDKKVKQGQISNCSTLTQQNNSKDGWFTKLKLKDKFINFKVDTGAMANVLPLDLFKSLKMPMTEIRKTSVKLKSYTGNYLNVLGICRLKCNKNNVNYLIDFFIVSSGEQAILGLQTCEKLELIKRINFLNSNEIISTNYREFLGPFETVFSGIGCIHGEHHIQLLPDAKPVVHATRRVPLPILNQLKETLDELIAHNVIEKVDGPSDWVNALVVVRKPDGKLRICLDPQDLNRAIKREYCAIPTLEQITSKLAGATVFSSLDATNGFYQIQLDKMSSDLCTFGTPFGRYKFLRLPYGIKSAPEVFQTKFKSIFNLEGVEVYIDDIIIWGRNRAEHDARLQAVLQIAKENNVKFNQNKCKFGVAKLKYMGHYISGRGIEPDNSKIEAVLNMPQPTSKQDVQRLLGMLTYVSKFIPEFSTKTSPLRDLIKKEVNFEWTSHQEKAFTEIKKILTSKPVLQLYDVNKDVTVSVDSSKNGLGAVILQNSLPCAYASKTMTETQQRYAQIEKELLAICFGLTKFHDYVYGKKVTVETDHQPLISIFKKPLNKCPARLQRMLLQLQKYEINLVYKPGKYLLLADALSRATYTDNTQKDEIEEEIDAHVFLIQTQINATPEKINQIKEAIQNDPEMLELKHAITEGFPKNLKRASHTIKQYAKYKHELTVIDDLIYKGQSLVIPYKMRKDMIERIHYSHLGVNKCLKLAKDSVFWPTMTNEITQRVLSCHTCLHFSKSQSNEPLKSHEIPILPWNKVGSDIFEYNGNKYLLLIDYYSKYIEIENLSQNMTSNNIINKMKSVFSRHGIPVTLVTDGGTQYTSKEFDHFCKEWEFAHIVSSPTHAKSNGMSERNVQTAKNIFKKNLHDKKEIYMALLQYRSTPIFENVSPAEILMSRKLRTLIPTTVKKHTPKVASQYNSSTIKQKQAVQAEYFNKYKTKKLGDLPVNCNVYVQTKPNSTWTPGIVISKLRDRTYKIRLDNGACLIRNRKFIKCNEYMQNRSLPNLTYNKIHCERKEEREEPLRCYIELDSASECETSETPTVLEPEQHERYKTRSGRPIVQPERLNL
ncbi:uncharacterized protein K02A2.6-like [Zophobas morio]|uniref:uncharacterized protein K02A2.6-like n=1 Tax=Zophobas morio TaxID=2755281 RepID=UPI0030839F4E